MKIRLLIPVFLAFLFIDSSSADVTGIPNMELSTATSTAATQVSIWSLPDGGGDDLQHARVFGGGWTDATITLTLVDSGSYPVFLYPLEDLWLEAAEGNFTTCTGGSIADTHTDVNGQTTFSLPMHAGGSGSGLIVRVAGDTLTQAPLPFLLNSPDMNADLTVNLSDVIIFVEAYFGSYDVAADFLWDGYLNLSDVILLATGLSTSCPSRLFSGSGSYAAAPPRWTDIHKAMLSPALNAFSPTPAHSAKNQTLSSRAAMPRLA